MKKITFPKLTPKLITILSVIFVAVICLVIGLIMLIKPRQNTDETENIETEQVAENDAPSMPEQVDLPEITEETKKYSSKNCTTNWGKLMLINPNFQVDTDFIAQRKTELVNITKLYGITEANSYNGLPYLDPEAASHLNEMVQAYQREYPGHTFQTMSCFRSQGTSCGRLCVPTGGSDHHSGFTCDLIDTSYGRDLNTDTYNQHPDWQWLRANSYKYGFIDRFPEEWAGGTMDEPVNVDANGTTGLFETWHYRYVGVEAATEIASGKYNDGNYDSLEHYLKSTGKIINLIDMNASCRN